MAAQRSSKNCCSFTIIFGLSALLICLSVICHLIALVSDYWLTSDDDVQTNFLNLGLFKACFEKYVHKHEVPSKYYDGCHYLQSDYFRSIQDWLMPGWLYSARVLAVICLLLQLIGIVFFILLTLTWCCRKACCKDDYENRPNRAGCCEKCMMYATPILFIVTGMLIMSVCMIFGDNARRLQCKNFWVGGQPNNNHLGYSWGFEVASCVFTFIAGMFLVRLVVLKAREELDHIRLRTENNEKF